jgi:hypothetical protein
MKTKYNTINNKIKKLQQDKNNIHKNNRDTEHSFFKQAEKLTDVTFTEKALQLLNKGLECNLHHKPKTWIKTLVMEADTGIRALPKKDQAYMRQLTANNIKKLIKEQNINNKKKGTKHVEREYHEWHTIKNIKLSNSQLTVTKVDKGNTLVIMRMIIIIKL